MTATTPVFRHPGPRPAALAERLAAGLGAAANHAPAGLARTTAFAASRPTLAIAAASGVAGVLTSRRADQRHEARCAVLDGAARIDRPASRMAALDTRPHGETATGNTARLAGPGT